MSKEMISFLTLFVGLVFGPTAVEVQVAPEVAAVEFRLDGAALGTLTGPPWRLEHDFGPTPRPARLVAVAKDGAGEELARAEQWLNLPKPHGVISLLLSRDKGPETGSGRILELAWESVSSAEPESVQVTLDGVEVPPGEDLARWPLPDHDPQVLHFLRAEASFEQGVTAAGDLVFGGAHGERVRTELTAIPLRIEGRRGDLEVGQLEGWLEAAGQELRPVAVEGDAGEALFVLDAKAGEQLAQMARQEAMKHTDPTGNQPAPFFRWAKLAKGQRLRFLVPAAETQARRHGALDVFRPSPPFEPSDGGVLMALSTNRLHQTARQRQTLADAVAVGGLIAARQGRPRALVLITTLQPEDHSELSPHGARTFLDLLQVPFEVWTLEDVKDGEEIPGWGPARGVGNTHRFDKAVKDLRRRLEGQRIVWVEGTHRPQDVRLTAKARGVVLVADLPTKK